MRFFKNNKKSYRNTWLFKYEKEIDKRRYCDKKNVVVRFKELLSKVSNLSTGGSVFINGSTLYFAGIIAIISSHEDACVAF